MRVEGIAGALTVTSAWEDTLNTNKLVRHRKMFYRFGFGSHQPGDNSDPYRLGHHSSLDSDGQKTILDDESLSNKKRLSALSYFAGVLHSPSQPERAKRDAFTHLFRFSTRVTNHPEVYLTIPAIEFLGEYLLLGSEGNTSGGHELPQNYQYLDEHLMLPAIFARLKPTTERGTLLKLLRCIQIELKFPPIDFLRIFMPLLDGHSADFQIIELILDFLLKQVAFSPDILKILVKYLLANIQRKKHLSYILLKWEILAPNLLKELDSMPEAMRMCVFLVRRAPTRLCTFDSFWRLLSFQQICHFLPSLFGMLDHAKPTLNLLDIWWNLGKCLNHLNSLKTRGCDDFLKTISYLPLTGELIKISMTLTKEILDYNDLHKNLSHLILRSKKRKTFSTIYKFLMRADISKKLAIEWMPDILQVLKEHTKSEEALEVFQFLAQRTSGKPFVFSVRNTKLNETRSARINLQAQVNELPETVEGNLRECVYEGLRTKSKWAKALVPYVMKKGIHSAEISELIYA